MKPHRGDKIVHTNKQQNKKSSDDDIFRMHKTVREKTYYLCP